MNESLSEKLTLGKRIQPGEALVQLSEATGLDDNQLKTRIPFLGENEGSVNFQKGLDECIIAVYDTNPITTGADESSKVSRAIITVMPDATVNIRYIKGYFEMDHDAT